MTEYNIKKGITQFKALVLISTISYILGVHTLGIFAQEAPISSKERISEVKVTCYATTQLLSSLSNLDEGALIKTAGFYVPGDGGNALYRIQKLNDELQPNGADVIALNPKQCRISKSSIFKTKDNNKPSVLVWHPSAPLRTGFDNSDFDIRILRPFGKTQGRSPPYDIGWAFELTIYDPFDLPFDAAQG